MYYTKNNNTKINCPLCGYEMKIVPCPDWTRTYRCSNPYCKNNRVRGIVKNGK